MPRIISDKIINHCAITSFSLPSNSVMDEADEKAEIETSFLLLSQIEKLIFLTKQKPESSACNHLFAPRLQFSVLLL